MTKTKPRTAITWKPGMKRTERRPKEKRLRMTRVVVMALEKE